MPLADTTSVISPDSRVSPVFNALSPPIIVIGMHRSGTSMVVGMLHRLGVFMDPELQDDPLTGEVPGERARTDGYGEAVAFRLSNESVMTLADADWQYPAAFMAKRDDPGFTKLAIEKLVKASETTLQTDYLDRCRGGKPEKWGWKDPRTSLTLPYWLALFPEARLLHIRRDNEAIIRSLQKRETIVQREAAEAPPSALQRIKAAAANPAVLMRALRRRVGAPVIERAPMAHDTWLQLADLHLNECLAYRDHAAGYLEMSYEEITGDPVATAKSIAEFAGITAEPEMITRAAGFVRVDRKAIP